MRRFIAILISFLFIVGIYLGVTNFTSWDDDYDGPTAGRAFEEWLNDENHDSSSRRESFAEFQLFLEREGVDKVVPNWQLWRADADFARRCGVESFAVPPRKYWPQIVPTLKVLRAEVIPVTGPLMVVSGYRSPEINECVKGASRSKHLTFAALDLIAINMTSPEQLFSDLCVLQGKVGSEKAMGLGAYYDPELPFRGSGRFHIDTKGFRTWGFDYSSKSNPCPHLR